MLQSSYPSLQSKSLKPLILEETELSFPSFATSFFSEFSDISSFSASGVSLRGNFLVADGFNCDARMSSLLVSLSVVPKSLK